MTTPTIKLVASSNQWGSGPETNGYPDENEEGVVKSSRDQSPQPVNNCPRKQLPALRVDTLIDTKPSLSDVQAQDATEEEEGDVRGRRRSKLLDGMKRAWGRSRSRSHASESSVSSATSSPWSPITPSAGSSGGGTRKKFLDALPHYHNRSRRAGDMADSPSNDKKLSYQEWVTRAEQLAASFNVTCVRPEGPISDASTKDLQRAIDLYESSHFVEATTLFKDLAGRQDAPPLSQVLYGLSLRNGWGCSTDMVAGFANFQRAVVSATRISGGKDAYGEMAVGLFELGNCYRNGWGCDRNDQVARQYYETAANLGDADAMLSAAECCLNGIGGTKNKHLAAMYYRMAEPLGRAEVGNSWIW